MENVQSLSNFFGESDIFAFEEGIDLIVGKTSMALDDTTVNLRRKDVSVCIYPPSDREDQTLFVWIQRADSSG